MYPAVGVRGWVRRQPIDLMVKAKATAQLPVMAMVLRAQERSLWHWWCCPAFHSAPQW